jgi:hypothetical protein
MKSKIPLPAELQTWFMAHMPAETMLWKKAFTQQVLFVRDELVRAFFKDCREETANPVLVVGTHVSKSILLPIYQLRRDGLVITLRDNYHDWCVSVQSDRTFYLNSLFPADLNEADGCFEGFTDINEFKIGDVLDNKPIRFRHYLNSNGRRFSFVVRSEYQVYTGVHILSQSYGGIVTPPQPT